MNRAVKKGQKLIEALKGSVDMVPLSDIQDFYLRKQNTPFAIRHAQAYTIVGSDIVIVLGNMDLASKNVHQSYAREASLKAQEQEEAPEAHEEVVEEAVEASEELLEFTEDDIHVLMEQGGVSRETAIEALKAHGGDPLDALTALGK
ncbi:nascent polypeptide-associated complex subunit alpha [Nematocida sp. LUAm3]|nr:nascent polypeptide-associated complex subunit alpha [Nematocida sp. LUAm3]KAI5174007.1 nascent polypeptide-associated complex subunit alpha [Nematocida sp. LUAm2]KAI5177249.1 nascent polypeptide-associated complex subunit alpha [Nematocida sp. LUAm1]